MIQGLLHQTTFKSLKAILKDKFLYTSIEQMNIKKIDKASGFTMGHPLSAGQFPGIYLSVYFDYFRNKTFNETQLIFEDADMCVLVLSKRLLDRTDYHLNLFDQNGMLTKNSYCKQTLHSLPTLIEDEMNEVVFHNKISVDCIEEIWVFDAEGRSIVEDLGLNVVETNKFVNKVYDKKIEIKNFDISFCTSMGLMNAWNLNKFVAIDLATALKIAENCGLPALEYLMWIKQKRKMKVIYLDDEDREIEVERLFNINDITLAIQRKQIENIEGKLCPPIKFYPPFSEPLLIGFSDETINVDYEFKLDIEKKLDEVKKILNKKYKF